MIKVQFDLHSLCVCFCDQSAVSTCVHVCTPVAVLVCMCFYEQSDNFMFQYSLFGLIFYTNSDL